MSRSTLSIAKDLEANGFTRAQAESLAEAILEATENDIRDLVTKDYLGTEISVAKAELKADLVTKDYLDTKISAAKAELKADLVTKDYLDTEISAAKAELKVEIAEVRTELKADIAEARTEIRDSKIATIKWMVGLQFVGFGFTFGFIYFILNFLLRHAKLLEKLLVAAQTG